MSKRSFVSLATLLAATNLAIAADPMMPPESLPAPSPLVSEEPIGFFSEITGPGCRRAVTAEAEFMLWFIKNRVGSFPISTIDALGQNVNLSSNNLDDKNGPISGGRFTFGYWQIQDNAWVEQGIRDSGVESRFFFMGRRSVDAVIDTPPVLFRPFFDLNNRVPSGALVAAPGLATGFISASGHTDVWGAEANAWKTIFYNHPGTSYAVRAMAGVRYLNSTSALDITATSVFAPAIMGGLPFAGFRGNRLQVYDSFSADNHFFGGQLGIALDGWFMECLCFETSARVAIGNTNQQIKVFGNQVRTFEDGSTTNSLGGLLALPSNIGKRNINKFTQVPEIDFKVKAPIGRYLTLSSGFSAMYWSNVLRASEQIDRSIDITQIPNFPAAGATPTGLGRPAIPFKQADLWLLGISVGAEINW